MVSYAGLALALGIIAILIAVLALFISIYCLVGLKCDRSYVERSTAEATASPDSIVYQRAQGTSSTTNQFPSTSFRRVPEISPQILAPNLQKPPKVSGGFGSKTDKS